MTPSSMVTPISQTIPIEINSNTLIPMLTNGQSTLQSSSLPNTNLSAVEDPTNVTARTSKLNAIPGPKLILTISRGRIKTKIKTDEDKDQQN